MVEEIRLTQFSHGGGCGCKISPAVLSEIVKSDDIVTAVDPNLLVGNESRDDAAVYNVNGTGIVSTTDFFMPIVDDPYDFGRIAATNAMSDVFAMGGKPIMAIAVLGWPLEKLSPAVARRVVEGGRQTCRDAGIALCGGHSIDSPEPIFGLAVTGVVDPSRMLKNNTATVGCQLFLTKPLGVGILTTAEKKGKLRAEDVGRARDVMCEMNSVGLDIANSIPEVTALTDVTGFGLLGHLLEMCEGSNVGAEIWMEAIPRLPGVDHYISEGCVPGGCERNFASYGAKVSPLTDEQKALLCDPQTSGGLLIAVPPAAASKVVSLVAEKTQRVIIPLGRLMDRQVDRPVVSVWTHPKDE